LNEGSGVPGQRLYGADLAAIQHLGFGDFAASAAPGLLAVLRRGGVMEGRIIDLGCGDGTWLRSLVHAGYEAIGVDSSRSLVEIAHRTAPGAELHVASAHDFAFPACDAVTAIGEVLSYVEPGRHTAPPLARSFRKIAAALRPGGLLVFDVLVSSRRAPARYRTWRAGDSWAVLVDVTEDRRRARLTRDVTTFRRVGTGYRRGHERHVLVVATREAVTRALRAAGFSVRTLRSYGDFAMLPGRVAFVAKKVR
jgi:SAM-dependent methyltransferase